MRLLLALVGKRSRRTAAIVENCFVRLQRMQSPNKNLEVFEQRADLMEVRRALLHRWAVTRIYLLESHLLEGPPQLEMSHVLSAILATLWRPVRYLDISHIKSEFSSCCQNTSALVVYLLVTMPESARKGKYVRSLTVAGNILHEHCWSKSIP